MLEESYALFVPRFPHSATGYMPSENRSREVAMATDAIVLLKEDHKKVQQLFKRFEGLGANASKTKKEIGDAMKEAKKFVPTRPHPRAPDTPPLNVIAGTTAAVADKVIDLTKDVVRKATRGN